MIILGQVAIVTGVKEYYDIYTLTSSPLGIIHIVVFFALILICEVSMRLYKMKEPNSFRKPEITMTVDEFTNIVSKGEKQLVLLDDIVLDVSYYMDNYPGGKFLLSHNVGRDVSKFFYGGYALDNNDVK